MKSINKQIRLTYLLGFNLLIFTVLFFLYNYLKAIVESYSNNINIILSGVSIVFMIIGLSVLVFSFAMYMFLKKQNDKLVTDVETLGEHVQEISDKQYDSAIKIKYYSDLLQISLVLKNIVKRLNKKY